MRRFYRSAICLSAALCVAGATGCGSARNNEIVADIAGQPITKSELAHWMRVLKGGRTVSDLSAPVNAPVREQALGLLISARWLSGEAASHDITVSGLEISREIDHVFGTNFPGGAAELREFLDSTGQTRADVELRAKARLIAGKLREAAIERAPAVTYGEVSAFYERNMLMFRSPEQREARFTNRKTIVAAERLKHEVEAGRSLTSPAQRKVHEFFTGAQVPPSNEYERAIDGAPLHVVSGPYKIHADYWLYEVVKVTPAHQRTLGEVAGQIRSKLDRERQQAALASFDRTLTRKWRAKTDCKPGYVVSRCRQHAATSPEEDPLSVQ